VNIIKLLFDRVMSVNLTDRDERSALHDCAQLGHLEATKALIEGGSAVNDTTKNGFTPLMVASFNGKLEIFRYFTEFGADINILHLNNNSALHLAAESGSVFIMK